MYNGKLLFVKNSKRGTRLIISYWTVEETEDDGEDEVITLVQFVTDILCVYYSRVFIYLYILQILCIQNVPQCQLGHGFKLGHNTYII